MERSGGLPDLPDCPAPHIYQQLIEVGPSMAGAMGAAPLTFGEIDAWVRRAGITLPPWQAKMLVRLSRDYVGELHRAEEHGCPPPWAEEPISDDKRAAISREISTGFKALIIANKRTPATRKRAAMSEKKVR